MKFKIMLVFLFATVMFVEQNNAKAEVVVEIEPQRRIRSRRGHGHNQATIYGHTIDKYSKEHLAYITIRIKGTTIGVASDAGGHFQLQNVPAGDVTIIASGVGYKSLEKNISLEQGESIDLSFEMEEDAIMLDNIVISSNRNETKRREAPNVVNVITSKLFENTNSVCLSDGLNFQPGVRVENKCQNCGFQQVRINGLDGPYSQILIDNRPIFSALAGVYGIEQIPANMIERVEVVRGGGSALFGSNAIAGTINIITKEPMNNSLTIHNSSMLIAGTAADISTTINAALVSDGYRSGVSIYGSSRQRDPWDANNDGYSEIGVMTAKNIGFRSYFKTTDQSKLTVEYHNLGEFRRGGNKLDLPAHEADITEQTDHNINTGGFKWDFFTRDYKHRMNVYASAQGIHRESYYGTGQDPNAYGLTKDLSYVAGAQYAFSMDKLIFMPADLTAGAEYNFNELIDKQLGYERQIDQAMHIKSVFLQNEWKNKALSLLLGMRLDKHNLIQQPIFSPRINFRYNPKEWINLRVSYAEGFRAPQAFDEDLHITAAGGVVQIIDLDPNLKPENSKSYSISADFYKNFNKVQTNLLIEAFYTDIDQVFYLDKVGPDADGNMLLLRKNGSGAVVQGINIEAKVIPSNKLDMQAGFTLQSSLYKDSLEWSPDLEARREMFRSPNVYGYLTTTYKPIKPMTFALSGIYTGEMLVRHNGVEAGSSTPATADEEIWTQDFFDLGLKVAYDFKIGKNSILQLNGGVQNIFNSFQKDFDVGETRDADFVYGPSLPRSFYIGAKLSL